MSGFLSIYREKSAYISKNVARNTPKIEYATFILSKEHFENQLCYARRKFELLERFSQCIVIFVKISAKSAKYLKKYC